MAPNSFQFHIGAIISTVRVAGRIEKLGFQFHIGAIISLFIKLRVFFPDTISIPHWCNYKHAGGVEARPVEVISIPHWCNYKLHHLLLDMQRRNHFNSTLVQL